MSDRSLTSDTPEQVETLLTEIRSIAGPEPFDVALILGSGWSDAVSSLEPLAQFDYCDWPVFPSGRVSGHPGKLVVMTYHGLRVLAFCGRFHCYQGFSAYDTTITIRLAAALGCTSVLLTCATGGINPDYSPGDIVCVADHINLMGENPLTGLEGETFVDLSHLYDTSLCQQLHQDVLDESTLHRGVLVALRGPSYETPAEIRMLAGLGGDVVSMSTVPEAIMARYLDLDVTAFALVANPAAGVGTGVIEHADVLACGADHTDRLRGVVEFFLDSIAYR